MPKRSRIFELSLRKLTVIIFLVFGIFNLDAGPENKKKERVTLFPPILENYMFRWKKYENVSL